MTGHSEGTKEKMRKAATGQTHSVETKQKMSKTVMGRTHSAETKQKSRAGIIASWSNKKQMFELKNLKTKKGEKNETIGCEGIVSKRLGSPYRSWRSPHWVKVKNPKAPAVKREAEEDWMR
jgi:hypothetical protein